MSQENTPLLSRPFQNNRVICLIDLRVPDVNNVNVRIAPQETTNNLAVEVLVSGQLEHLFDGGLKDVRASHERGIVLPGFAGTRQHPPGGGAGSHLLLPGDPGSSQ